MSWVNDPAAPGPPHGDKVPIPRISAGVAAHSYQKRVGKPRPAPGSNYHEGQSGILNAPAPLSAPCPDIDVTYDDALTGGVG